MVATWNIAAASSYYSRGVEYYLGGREPDGVWYAPAGDFGRQDESRVSTHEFSALYDGLGDDGKPLVSTKGGKAHSRVPAYDFTFSAPRSVSLLWAFGDAEQKRKIEAAQNRAARASLAAIEREAAFARRGKGGARVEKIALTVAMFQHGESRPATHVDGRVFADPNLHTHCVIMNLATRPDGSVGALHSNVLREWKMTAGAVYHSALAKELNDLGFSVDRIGKNGVFEIAGVDDTAIQYFSARRQEINAELAEAGTASSDAAALAAAIAKSTRHAKTDLDQTDREIVWRDAARSAGLEERIQAALHPALASELASSEIERRLAERLAVLPGELTQHESVVERRELVRATHAALVGLGLPVSRADAELDRRLNSGAFVGIGRDAIGLPRYSTHEMVAVERDVVDMAGELARKPWAHIDPAETRSRSERSGLNIEQIVAAETATGPQAIAIIEGAPGAGKTTTLTPIVDAYRHAGKRVVGTASAWRIARDLQSDLGIEARATASWVELLKTGGRFLDRNTVLIVDEAGLLSSRDMHALLSEARRAEAKIILVGDRKQLQAIGAGPGLDLVMRSVEAARVDTIVRQKEEWARQAVTDFGAGRAQDALSAFSERGYLEEAQSHSAALRRIVELWGGRQKESLEHSVLLIARTNAQVADISRAVRRELKQSGVIHGQEATIAAVTPSGHASQIEVAAGDKIRFLLRNDALGVVNGTVAEVVAVHCKASPEPGTRSNIRIEAVVGERRIEFSPRDIADEQGRARLGWAYASTVYGAQGLTVDRAYVLLDGQFDRHAIHVAASRAREETRLIVDCSLIDVLIAARLPLDQSQRATPAFESERREFLAERLSASSAKSSTVAVIEEAKASLADAAGFVHSRPLESFPPSSRSMTGSNAERKTLTAPSRSQARGLDHEL